jgi:hypothetical protein
LISINPCLKWFELFFNSIIYLFKSLYQILIKFIEFILSNSLNIPIECI